MSEPNELDEARAKEAWPFIALTDAEVQSRHDRQRWAEGLIIQLPSHHDGRNSWLLNYGVGAEAQALREKHGYAFNSKSRAINPPSRQLAEAERGRG